MPKKSVLKNFLSYLPIATLAIGLLVSGVRFQVQAEQTKSEVKDLKAEVKEITNEGDKEIKELKAKDQNLEKAVEVAQVKQAEIQKKVEEISNKSDKIVELLLDIKQKKR